MDVLNVSLYIRIHFSKDPVCEIIVILCPGILNYYFQYTACVFRLYNNCSQFPADISRSWIHGFLKTAVWTGGTGMQRPILFLIDPPYQFSAKCCVQVTGQRHHVWYGFGSWRRLTPRLKIITPTFTGSFLVLISAARAKDSPWYQWHFYLFLPF